MGMLYNRLVKGGNFAFIIAFLLWSAEVKYRSIQQDSGSRKRAMALAYLDSGMHEATGNN